MYWYLKDNKTSSGLYSSDQNMSYHPSNNINPGSPLLSSICIGLKKKKKSQNIYANSLFDQNHSSSVKWKKQLWGDRTFPNSEALKYAMTRAL